MWLADLVVAHFSSGPYDPELKHHLAEKYRNQVSVCDLAAIAAKAIEATLKAGPEPDVSDLGRLTGQIQAAFESRMLPTRQQTDKLPPK